jgi:hypothetical protein
VIGINLFYAMISFHGMGAERASGWGARMLCSFEGGAAEVSLLDLLVALEIIR